jgi:NADPH:quinone reductase-like Zn-dependent oxidoreductase
MGLSAFVRQLPSPDFSMPKKAEAMALLKALLEGGKLTPIIDRAYPLAEVSAALEYLAGGQARGRIVITP